MGFHKAELRAHRLKLWTLRRSLGTDNRYERHEAVFSDETSEHLLQPRGTILYEKRESCSAAVVQLGVEPGFVMKVPRCHDCSA